jgi:hypothetical protein
MKCEKCNRTLSFDELGEEWFCAICASIFTYDSTGCFVISEMK